MTFAQVFYRLVYMSLTGLCAGVAVLVVRWLADTRISPFWKYAMWLLVLGALVVPFRLQSKLAVMPDASDFGQISYRDDELYARLLLADYKTQEYLTITEQRLETLQNLQNEIEDLHFKSILFETVIPTIWISGFMAILSFMLYVGVRLRMRIATQTLDTSERYVRILERCKQLLGVNQDVRIIMQKYVSTPALIGVWRPAIILPPYLDDIDDERVMHVLLHELAHLKRHDLIINYLLLFLQAVYWFNPLLWGLFRFVRQDMEVANDAFVLSVIGNEQRKSYGLSLVAVLASYNNVLFGPRLLCMVDGKHNMERRIRMLKLGESFRKRRVVMAIAGVVIMSGIGAFFLTTQAGGSETAEASVKVSEWIQTENDEMPYGSYAFEKSVYFSPFSSALAPEDGYKERYTLLPDVFLIDSPDGTRTFEAVSIKRVEFEKSLFDDAIRTGTINWGFDKHMNIRRYEINNASDSPNGRGYELYILDDSIWLAEVRKNDVTGSLLWSVHEVSLLDENPYEYMLETEPEFRDANASKSNRQLTDEEISRRLILQDGYNNDGLRPQSLLPLEPGAYEFYYDRKNDTYHYPENRAMSDEEHLQFIDNAVKMNKAVQYYNPVVKEKTPIDINVDEQEALDIAREIITKVFDAELEDYEATSDYFGSMDEYSPPSIFVTFQPKRYRAMLDNNDFFWAYYVLIDADTGEAIDVTASRPTYNPIPIPDEVIANIGTDTEWLKAVEDIYYGMIGGTAKIRKITVPDMNPITDTSSSDATLKMEDLRAASAYRRSIVSFILNLDDGRSCFVEMYYPDKALRSFSYFLPNQPSVELETSIVPIPEFIELPLKKGNDGVEHKTRVSLALEVEKNAAEAFSAALKEESVYSEYKGVISEVLSNFLYEELMAVDGLSVLSQTLIEAIQERIEDTPVTKVFITEFYLQ